MKALIFLLCLRFIRSNGTKCYECKGSIIIDSFGTLLNFCKDERDTGAIVDCDTGTCKFVFVYNLSPVSETDDHEVQKVYESLSCGNWNDVTNVFNAQNGYIMDTFICDTDFCNQRERVYRDRASRRGDQTPETEEGFTTLIPILPPDEPSILPTTESKKPGQETFSSNINGLDWNLHLVLEIYSTKLPKKPTSSMSTASKVSLKILVFCNLMLLK